MTIPFALLSAFGMFLFVDALRPRRPRVQLHAPDQRPLMARLLETFFAPAAERVLRIRSVDIRAERAALTERLKRANYPPPYTSPDAVLAYRFFMALLEATFGAIAGLLLGLGSGTFAVMALLAVIGWITPDRALAGAEAERVEQLTLDAASTLDRLGIHVSAGSALPMAIREVAEQPGGAWVAELRKVTTAYLAGGKDFQGGDFAAAVDEVIARSGRLSEIARVLERLKAANEMGGGGTAKALRQMAQDARTTIKVVLTDRGHRNTTLMVIPASLAILATIIVLLAPGMARLMAQLLA